MSDCAVSVIIPTRHRAQTLPLALESVARQSTRDWECLVVDDHSTDETPQLLEQYGRRDRRFRYVPVPAGKNGANAARNLGVESSVGRYLLFLDSDDALADPCLEERLVFMESQPDLDFAVWNTQLFQTQPGDSDLLWNVPGDEPDLSRFLALDVPWQTCGVFWRRKAVQHLGRWDEALLSWQDWEYHIRALALGLRYQKRAEVDCLLADAPGGFALEVGVQRQPSSTQRGRLFAHIQRLLRKTRNPALLKKLTGLYFWQARVWRQNSGSARQAAGLWTQAWLRRLVGTKHYWAGRSLLYQDPLLWPALLQEMAKNWPREYLETGTSTTFQKLRRLPSTQTRES